MAYINELRDTLDALMLSAEQIGALLQTFDLHALRDMMARLQAEIRAVRREILLLDAGNLISLADRSGGVA